MGKYLENIILAACVIALLDIFKIFDGWTDWCISILCLLYLILFLIYRRRQSGMVDKYFSRFALIACFPVIFAIVSVFLRIFGVVEW